MHSRITKLAAAAVLALAVLLLARHLTGHERVVTPESRNNDIVQVPQNREDVPAPIIDAQVRPDRELASAQELFAAADVGGLLQLLETGQEQTKIAVADYLAQMGEESAIPALQQLASQWQGPVEDNPFVKSVEQIRNTPAGREKAADQNVKQEPVSVNPPKATSSGRRITVHVSEKATGVPIPNAGIRIDVEGEMESRTYAANEEGVFVLDLAASAPKWVTIMVAQKGYVGQIAASGDLDGQSLPKTVKFSLEKSVVVGGIVQDSAGHPIRGATVTTGISGHSSFERPCIYVRLQQTTDDQGRWRSDGLPAQIDSDLRFVVLHPNFVPGCFATSEGLSFDDLRAERAVMVLDEGMTVTGRVTDPAGAPIADAQLLAGEIDNGIDSWIRTDVKGCFSISHVSVPGPTFLLTAQAKGYAPQCKELAFEKGLPPVEFVLEPAQILLGRVVDTAGQPVEGVNVSLDHWTRCPLTWSDKTDANGMFLWDSPPADKFEITIGREGYEPTFPKVVADGQEHVFVLLKSMIIQGVVTDSQTGEPIPRFKVIPGTRQHDRDEFDPVWTKEFTDGHYSYVFHPIGGAHAVRVEAEGYEPQVSRFVDANEQGVTIDIALTRSQEGGPCGYVFDANDSPVAGAQVVWSQSVLIRDGQAEPRDQVHTTADENGRFAFKATASGHDPLLAVSDRGIGGASYEEFARNGVINIRLKPWARVEGLCRIGSRPAINQRLRLWPRHDQALSQASLGWIDAVTDENGRFVFERVYPGQFRLRSGQRRGGDDWVTLGDEGYSVEPGQSLELSLGGTGRTVLGELAVSVASDVPTQAVLELIPMKAPALLGEVPKPAGYAQMSLQDVRVWLLRLGESSEGRTYAEWLGQDSSRRSERLLIRTDDGRAFRVDNVKPGLYALKGTIRRRTPDTEVVGYLWHEFEVPAFASDSEMDIPLELGLLPVVSGELQPGDVAPNFDVPTFGSERICLTDYRGKVVLVTFSKLDQAILDEFKALHSRFHENSRYAQVSLLCTDLLLGHKAVEEMGLDWPCGPLEIESKESIEYDIQPGTTSKSVLIGPQGEVLAVGLSGEALTQAIEEALASTR